MLLGDDGGSNLSFLLLPRESSALSLSESIFVVWPVNPAPFPLCNNHSWNSDDMSSAIELENMCTLNLLSFVNNLWFARDDPPITIRRREPSDRRVERKEEENIPKPGGLHNAFLKYRELISNFPKERSSVELTVDIHLMRSSAVDAVKDSFGAT